MLSGQEGAKQAPGDQDGREGSQKRVVVLDGVGILTISWSLGGP